MSLLPTPFVRDLERTTKVCGVGWSRLLAQIEFSFLEYTRRTLPDCAFDGYFSLETGTLLLYQEFQVVDQVSNSSAEISLATARGEELEADLGDEILFSVHYEEPQRHRLQIQEFPSIEGLAHRAEPMAQLRWQTGRERIRQIGVSIAEGRALPALDPAILGELRPMRRTLTRALRNQATPPNATGCPFELSANMVDAYVDRIALGSLGEDVVQCSRHLYENLETSIGLLAPPVMSKFHELLEAVTDLTRLNSNRAARMPHVERLGS